MSIRNQLMKYNRLQNLVHASLEFYLLPQAEFEWPRITVVVMHDGVDISLSRCCETKGESQGS